MDDVTAPDPLDRLEIALGRIAAARPRPTHAAEVAARLDTLIARIETALAPHPLGESATHTTHED